MKKTRIEQVRQHLLYLGNRPNWWNIPIPRQEIINIQNGLTAISYDIISVDSYFSRELPLLSDKLFIEPGVFRPAIFGQIIAILNRLLYNADHPENDVWHYIHPMIIKSSQKLYLDGHFANAAADAFIEINDRVKKLYATVRPGANLPDGDSLMKTTFSPQNPAILFCDLSTTTGYNIQKGYMEMLAGAMSALRNPKAHKNISITADDAMRRLQFASMLMYKIDEAVAYSKIQEA